MNGLHPAGSSRILHLFVIAVIALGQGMGSAAADTASPTPQQRPSASSTPTPAPSPTPSPTPSPSGLTPAQRWAAEVATALQDAPAYVRARAAQVRAAGGRPALNLDIDNTSLATYYDRGHAMPATLALVRVAKADGVAILFNTGRSATGRAAALHQLAAAGYPVDGLCMRPPHGRLASSKQRCRAAFVADGYTIVANVGNRTTDFVGGDYDRAFRLPDDGGRLG